MSSLPASAVFCAACRRAGFSAVMEPSKAHSKRCKRSRQHHRPKNQIWLRVSVFSCLKDAWRTFVSSSNVKPVYGSHRESKTLCRWAQLQPSLSRLLVRVSLTSCLMLLETKLQPVLSPSTDGFTEQQLSHNMWSEMSKDWFSGSAVGLMCWTYLQKRLNVVFVF